MQRIAEDNGTMTIVRKCRSAATLADGRREADMKLTALEILTLAAKREALFRLFEIRIRHY
jgi:hypothetical protein